jgi:hypothetical protein
MRKQKAHNLSSEGGYSDRVLENVFVVNEIAGPAVICRRNAILSSNQAFADLIGCKQTDLIGCDIAEIADTSFRKTCIDCSQEFLMRLDNWKLSCEVHLKTVDVARKRAVITVRSLDQMRGALLLMAAKF